LLVEVIEIPVLEGLASLKVRVSVAGANVREASGLVRLGEFQAQLGELQFDGVQARHLQVRIAILDVAIGGSDGRERDCGGIRGQLVLIARGMGLGVRGERTQSTPCPLSPLRRRLGGAEMRHRAGKVVRRNISACSLPATELSA
jgi:hypothetical protein